MAIVRIEGKEIPLDDDIVNAGKDAVVAVLSANGFPGASVANIEIVGPKKPGGSPSVKVTSRATTKGGGPKPCANCGHVKSWHRHSVGLVSSWGTTMPMSRLPGEESGMKEFLDKLTAAPEYRNPAIRLAQEIMAAEASGDTDLLERAIRSGEVERAIVDGTREGEGVDRMLSSLGHSIPQSSKTVPVGF